MLAGRHEDGRRTIERLQGRVGDCSRKMHRIPQAIPIEDRLESLVVALQSGLDCAHDDDL